MWSASEKFVQFLRQGPYEASLSDDDARHIASLPVVERFYPAGTMLMEEEETRRANMFIASGLALSCKSMASGHRVVADLLQRGDFVGADGTARKVHRSVQSATDVTTFEIDIQRSMESVGLVSLMVHLMARNCDIVAEHLANVSRRRPLERVAWLLLETAHRHEQAGLGKGAWFSLPLTQRDLADAVGITAIHVNRLLRTLRERQLLRFQHWTVELIDKAALTEMTAFNSDYLTFIAGAKQLQ